MRTTIVVVVVLLIVGVSLYWWADSAPRPTTSLFWDWRLKITIHDASAKTNFTLPAGIGVTGGIWMNHTLDAYGPPGYSPLSTRDDSSTVYIQSTVNRFYTFGDFFNVYGHPFDRRCVPDGRGSDYCSTQNPPVMSDGSDERCVERGRLLSNAKDWVIIINTTLGQQIGCAS